MSNEELQKSEQQKQVATLRDLLEKAKPRLAEVAPKHLSIDRLVRLLLVASSRNPKILECTSESVLRFAMSCSSAGLEPIGAGGMWPVPFRNNKTNTMELTAIPDYRGLVNCAKRAKCITDAYAEVVREKDQFNYELGTEPFIKHKPARGDRGELEAAYCVIVLPGGTKRFEVMGREEIHGIRNRSQAWRAFLKYKKEGPWNTDESECFRKTIVRRAMKPFVGASSQLDAAVEADDLASGVIDNAIPAPIAMPKALPPATPEGDAPESKPATAEDDDNIPMGGEVPAECKPKQEQEAPPETETPKNKRMPNELPSDKMESKVVDMVSETKTDKNGKEYVVVRFASGEKITVYDKKFDIVPGESVLVELVQSGKYWNLKSWCHPSV